MLKKVLIVDDNLVNRKILAKILADEYQVITAKNGAEALETLNEYSGEVSVVLLDLVMPVMDGYEFLRQRQNDKKLLQIPVIVTTQDDSEETESIALSLGAIDFLSKPYKPLIIKRRLQNIIKMVETAAFINTIENDSLTGVYSKEFFYQKAEEILANNPDKQYILICTDIERFKLVNDLFGKEEGDKILKYLAQMLKGMLHKDELCGRISADIFAVLEEYDPVNIGSCVRKAVEQLNHYQINIKLNLKCGIYIVDDRSVPIDVMCDRATLAAASIKGKYDIHFAYYDNTFREKMLWEQLINDSMNSAIGKGEFKVCYQPKYSFETGKICGAEALIRWIHPQKGYMRPAEFIPVFERNGFITTMDMFVWEEACKDISRWLAMGIDIPSVSVNVSRIDIYNPNLTDILVGLVKKYKINPKYLHLEITESAYTENPTQLIEVLKNLKNLGFVIEMDDFGNGYSSLNMLNELPIDMLKLDIRFLQSKAGRSGVNIIKFIIELAKSMGLTVVAEGVETKEQAQMLKDLQCHYAQGYYYSKPMKAKVFEELIVAQLKER